MYNYISKLIKWVHLRSLFHSHSFDQYNLKPPTPSSTSCGGGCKQEVLICFLLFSIIATGLSLFQVIICSVSLSLNLEVYVRFSLKTCLSFCSQK